MRRGPETAVTDTADKDLRLVCVAAMAWLHEHDYPGEHADGMDAEVDPGELAAAIDRLTLDGGQAPLIEQMADALSVCGDLLNGRDSMMDAVAGGEGPVTKSPLTAKVDEAMNAWRKWKFG